MIMRQAIAISLLVLATGCSRYGATSVEPPVVDVPATPAPSATAPAPQASALVHPSAAHAIRITDEPIDKEMPSPLLADIQPGDAPCAAFPSGTAYVADMDPKYDGPVWVTEWDLARATVVRKVRLPIPAELKQSHLLRVGDRLHVVVDAWNQSFAYVQLTKDLHVVHAEPLAGRLSAEPWIGLSADSRVAAILWSGDAPAQVTTNKAFVLATFDGSGRRLATRYAELGGSGPLATDDSGATEKLAVVDGHVFVLLVHQDEGKPSGSAELVRLRDDLTIEKRVVVKAQPDYALRLGARSGHLEVIDDTTTRGPLPRSSFPPISSDSAPPRKPRNRRGVSSSGTRRSPSAAATT